MIKRTIEVSTEGMSLSLKHGQMEVRREGIGVSQVPVEDIGILIVDTPQAYYTHGVVIKLMECGGVLVLCDEGHHPAAIVTPLEGHHTQAERLRAQVESSLPTQKRLWQQIVAAKIRNQAAILEDFEVMGRLNRLADEVRTGDPENHEAQAARIYWSEWLGNGEKFRRDRNGDPPNNLLNYGYMSLRACTARAIAAVGLHPSLGLKHCNKYNAFCLADDLMEPFRPLVDRLVRQLWREGKKEITRETKSAILPVLTHTASLDGQEGPLLVALERFAFSVYKCLAGKERNLSIPQIL